jgi:hypothetical protein
MAEKIDQSQIFYFYCIIQHLVSRVRARHGRGFMFLLLLGIFLCTTNAQSISYQTRPSLTEGVDLLRMRVYTIHRNYIF